MPIFRGSLTMEFDWRIEMVTTSIRLKGFTESVIRGMTRLSDKHDAINLSQGFPDFDPPKELLDALQKCVYAGPHQYAVTWGAPNFRYGWRKNRHASWK